MRINRDSFIVRASVVAVRGALVAMAIVPVAYSADEAASSGPTVAELTQPTNSVEVGAGYIDHSSAKFGEYNGHDEEGTYGIANIDLRGGGSYDSDSVTRWKVTGSDLGLDTRSLSGEFAEQGKFKIKLGYDVIKHNISDSYMTPYNGANSNNLTLPADWATRNRTCNVVANTTQGNTNFGGTSNASVGTQDCGNYYVGTSPTVTGNALALTAAELADFHHVNISTERKKYDGEISYDFNTEWQLIASTSHETKQGAVLIGQTIAPSGTGAQVTLPNPIDYTTNEFNLALAYTGDKVFAKLAGFASIFKNKQSAVTFDDAYATNFTGSATGAGGWPSYGRFAGAPSNDFWQVNFTGGYNFNPTTKLVVYAAYGRNTQDDALQLADTVASVGAGTFTNPAFNGKVVTKSVNLKLTARPLKDLNLAAAYKYDDRDNKSSSNEYRYNLTDGQAAAASETDNNAPYGRTLHQVNLDAGYVVRKGHAIAAGYEYTKTERTCSGAVDAIASGCINADELRDNSLRLEYRNTAFETVTGRLSYVYADRNASAYRNDPMGDQDIYTRFNSTDRQRDKVRALVNWQPIDALDLSAGLDYNNDDYDLGKNPKLALIYGAAGSSPNYGLKESESWVWNLDGSWKVNDKLALNAYYTYEDIESKLNGNACRKETGICTASNVPWPLSAWSARMKDRIDTFGLGFKAQPISKVDIAGDYVRSHSDSPYGLSAASQYAYNAANTGSAPLITTALPLSDKLHGVYSDSDTVKLNAKYTVDKHSAWRLSFEWSDLSSGDPMRYNGLQQGAATNTGTATSATTINGTAVSTSQVYTSSQLMPTNEKSPDYSVYGVGVSYIYNF